MPPTKIPAINIESACHKAKPNKIDRKRIPHPKRSSLDDGAGCTSARNAAKGETRKFVRNAGNATNKEVPTPKAIPSKTAPKLI